jgi:SulP family sulfate permease
LERILSEEKKDGLLLLENLEHTAERSKEITSFVIEKEAKNLANSKASGVLGSINILPRAIRHVNTLELALCLITIVIIYGFKRITKAIPSTLVALIGVTAFAVLFNLNYRPIEQIPSGFPMPEFRIFSEFKLGSVAPYLFTSLSLALLGAIDSLLTSVVADNMTKTRHLPNKELIGQGIGNGVAALFGGIPGAGATIRTVVNINSGGKTRLSGMIAGILLLIILLALGPVASKIPAAVLAGILITVGISVMDYRGLKAIPSLPKDVTLGPVKLSSEVIIMFVVMLLSAFWNLVYAVGIGLVLASLMFMKKKGDQLLSFSQVKPLSQDPSLANKINLPGILKEEIYIKHINGPLFFGSASDFIQIAEQVPQSAKALIIRLGRMSYLDQSGLYALEEVLHKLKNQGTLILFVNIQEQPRNLIEKVKIIPTLVPENQIFSSFKSCIDWTQEHIENPDENK